MPDKKQGFAFEASLSQLDALVQKMESGELSLEESLKAFEEGVKLTRECQKALSDAEQKVKILLENNGQLESQPFEPSEDS